MRRGGRYGRGRGIGRSSDKEEYMSKTTDIDEQHNYKDNKHK